MNTVHASKHAGCRLEERFDVELKNADRYALRAWKNGKHVEAFSGKIRKDLEEKALSHGKGAIVRVFADGCFIYSVDGTLITAYDYKNKLHRYEKRPRYYEVDDYDIAS